MLGSRFALGKAALGSKVAGRLAAASLGDSSPRTVGAFSVVGDPGSYSFASGVLTVKGAGRLTISNENPDAPTTDRIVIGASVTANVTLAGVDIDVSKTVRACALAVPADAILNLSLAEGSKSSLRSGTYRAGLEVPAGATLAIEGSGSLSATGGIYGAGIGAPNTASPATSSGGKITVSGGAVDAIGGLNAAGIGGALGGSGGEVAVSGGAVTATGGAYGVGIGGDSGGTTIVSGGTVTATGGYATGIGGRGAGSGGTTIISGGTVTATGGGGDPGIGGGKAAPSGGTFSTTGVDGGQGSAFLVASSIRATTDQGSWSGVIFGGDPDHLDDGKVYGSPALALDATVPAGKKLTVPEGHPLKLGDGVTLTNDGAIENHGGITGKNSLAGRGTVTSDSQVELTADPSSANYGDPIVLNAKVSQKAATPGSGAASPSGTVTFKVAEGGGTAQLGEPVDLEADPGGSGSAAALTLTSADPGYRYVQQTGKTAFTASYGGKAEPGAAGLSPATSKAAEVEMAAADLEVEGGSFGTDYAYESGVLTVLTEKALTIRNATPGKSTTDHIVVKGVTANVTLDGVNIDVSGKHDVSALAVPTDATLNLALAEGSRNFLKSSDTRAGLEVPAGATLAIEGPGSLSATGGVGGAGVGGGYNGAGGKVAVSGGSLSATGGFNAAGIGGGNNGGGGEVTVSGGTVTAIGGTGGPGIGGGKAASSGGTFSTKGADGSPGSAFVLASSINATADGSWSGVIFGGDPDHLDDGKVYGTPALALNATVPAGKKLTVPEGHPLKLGDGVTLTNDGAIENHGGITGKNSLAGRGTVTSDSQVELTADPSSANYGDPIVLNAKVSQKAATPGSGAASPSGTVTFKVAEGGGTAQLGEPVDLEADPGGPGSAAALTLTSADPGYRHVQQTGKTAFTATYGGRTAPITEGLSPATSKAAEVTMSAPDLTVEGGALGTDYAYESGVLTVLKSTPLTISGTTTSDRIVVGHGVTANVTLSGVSIDVSTHAITCALEVPSGAALNLTLAAGTSNLLKSGENRAGLQVPAGATLAIEGPGSLSATGGADAAGIGGHDWGAGGSVSVSSGSVTANGGSSGAGIGGGNNADGGSVSVSGGSVTANGGYSAAGIGAGWGNHGGSATVSGGSVTATGSESSPGISGAFSTKGADGSPGSAFVLASSIADNSPDKQAFWSGVIFQGNDGKVYGTPALALNATVPAGKKLTVPEGHPLALKGGVTLTNDGAIENHGGITGKNSLAGRGTVTSDSQVELSAAPSPAAYGSEVTLTARVSQKAETPGGAAAAPVGKVAFAVGEDSSAVSLGEAALEADPEHPGASLATLTTTAEGDAWAAADGDGLKASLKASFGGKAAAAGAPGLARADGGLSLKLGKGEVHPKVSIGDWTYGQDPKSPVLADGSNPGDGKVSYEYKAQGADDSTYEATVPTEAGDYALRATVGETERYAEGEATANFSIEKAPQKAPSLTAHGETVSGKRDGRIEGLTTAMAWAKSEDGDYESVADAGMPFSAGTYWVLLRGDDNHEASLPTEVTVKAGSKLKVALPAEQVGYTLTVDPSELDWRGSAKLSFELADGYVEGPGFAVKAVGAEISDEPGADGAYVLSDAEADVSVTVEGVAPEFTQQTVYDESHKASLSGMLASGASLDAVPLVQDDASYDALSKMALAAGQDAVSAYDVKLIGRYEGKLKASFEVGDAYEGKTLTVYHRKAPGDVEELRSVVEDGWASVEVDGLSPFLVAVDRDPAPAPQPAPQPGPPAPQPGGQGGGAAPQPAAPEPRPVPLPVAPGGAAPAPQTGDGLPLAPLALAVIASGAALVSLAVRKARSRRRSER